MQLFVDNRSDTGDLSPEQSGRSVKLPTRLHPVPRLRMTAFTTSPRRNNFTLFLYHNPENIPLEYLIQLRASFSAVDFFFCATAPPVVQGLLIHEASKSHTTTHRSRWDSFRRVISPTQRSLSDETQHPQQTDIHVSGRIRTRNLSRRAAADLRLRPRGHWDRQ